MSYNNLTGSIPAAWTSNGTLNQLVSLNLTGNRLAGGCGCIMMHACFTDGLVDRWHAYSQYKSLIVEQICKCVTCVMQPIGVSLICSDVPHLHLRIQRHMKRCCIPYTYLLHGTLRAWQSAIYVLYICISSELSLCRHIFFAGNLPDSWGAPRVLPELEKMFLGGNRFSGPLPAAWGGRDRLPKLLHLALNDNALEGTVPDSWVSTGAFATFVENANTYRAYSGILPTSFDDDAARFAGIM